MRLLNRLNISTRVFLGFGVVLLLLSLMAGVSVVSLFNADRNFKSYRALARQTNAEGRGNQLVIDDLDHELQEYIT